MKVFLSFLLGALTSSSSLLAQSAKMTSADSDLSLHQYSNINGSQPKLMMNPGELENLKAGAEALGEELGVFGGRAAQLKTVVGTTAAAHTLVGNSSSSAAMIGQGGVEITAALTNEDSEERADVHKFLEEEICDNIYKACLAKVATMSLAERQSAEGISQEAKEWTAARHMAAEEEKDFKNAWKKAKNETLAAQKKFDSANAIIHGKAYADEAYYNWQVKELAEQLAKARVITAHETLNAIQFRNTAQQNKVEVRLNLAIEKERKASDALAAATAHSSREEISTSSSPIKQNQVTPKTAGKISMGGEGADVPNTINLPASQSPVLFTSPKSPMSGHETAAISHSFVNPSIPIVEAVAIPSGNNLTGSDFLHQPKLSEERVIKKKIEAEALAEKEELEKFLEQIYIGEAKVAEEKIVLENKNTQLLEEATEAENITKEEDNTKAPEVAETKEPSYEKEQSQIIKTVQALVGRRNIWVGAAGAAIVGYTVLCRPAWAEIIDRVTNPCSYKSNEDINCIWMNKNLIANNAWNEANKNDQAASTDWYQAISNKDFTDYINTSSFSTAENFWNKAIATHQEALSVAPEVNKETLKKNIKEAQSKKDFWTKRISWSEAIEVAEMKLEKARNEENTHYGTVNEIYANQAGEFYVEVQSISNKSIKTDLACECINLLSNSLSDSDKIFQANQDYIFNRFKDAEHTFNEIVESFKVDSSNKDETNKTITFWIDKKDYFAKKFAQFQTISKRLEDTIAKREEDLIVSKNSVIREMPSTEILIRQKAEDQTKKENWILLSKEAHEKAAIAKTANKKDEGDSWSAAENNFDNAAQTLSKAIKAELKGESEVARKYREAAEQQVLSAEYYTQSAKAYALGKKEEGSDWNKAGYGLWYELINLDIAIQKEKLNPEEVRQYREVAEQYKCSVDPFVQAARAYAAKKINEVAGNWDNAAFGFYNAAGTLEKVIIAESSNEAEKAQKLRKAAKQYTCSGKVHIESARAYEQGKTNEGKSWYMAGNAFHNAANKLKNTIEVKTAEKLKEAQKWKEAAGFFIQAARAYAEEKKDEGDRWRNAGNGCYYAAVKLGKAIDADVAGKFAIAQKWREAAEQQVSSVDSFTKAVTAYAEGKIKEAASWNNAGFDFYWAGEKLEGAIESEASEEITEAQTLREQAEEHQKKALATQAQAKAQHIIAMKKEEGEAAFAEARKEKTVTE
ncbi:MAG TPA: hypothetical protein VJK54_03530 [Chthoniobacterales bacterium]|nr:hypothetical protein [Chthoniobacterales bacterium]